MKINDYSKFQTLSCTILPGSNLCDLQHLKLAFQCFEDKWLLSHNFFINFGVLEYKQYQGHLNWKWREIETLRHIIRISDILSNISMLHDNTLNMVINGLSEGISQKCTHFVFYCLRIAIIFSQFFQICIVWSNSKGVFKFVIEFSSKWW